MDFACAFDANTLIDLLLLLQYRSLYRHLVGGAPRLWQKLKFFTTSVTKEFSEILVKSFILNFPDQGYTQGNAVRLLSLTVYSSNLLLKNKQYGQTM